MKTGVLILNLGTPDDPSPKSVGRYLKQFLMDKWVVDIPFLVRAFLVYVLIVPKRKFASAEAYEKVWTHQGSPLLFHSKNFVTKLKAILGSQFEVKVAMRYGNPSISDVLGEFQKSQINNLIVIPMYPQYAESSVRSSLEELKAAFKKLNFAPSLKIVPPFHSSQGYLDSYAELIRPHLSPSTHLLMSYHGLPERHVQKTDLTGKHCLKSQTCCDSLNDANRFCYRAHCFATSRGLAERLGLSREQYSVSFQSRLGRSPWIKPYTDFLYKDLINQGKTNLVVVSPSFVTDCLETIEELGMRLREDYLRDGGTAFTLVPCLNDSDQWVAAVSDVVDRVAKT